MVANAIQDLRKVKVAQVLSKNLTAGLMSATLTSTDCNLNTSRHGNTDVQVDFVIERCLDNEFEKSELDTYTYR